MMRQVWVRCLVLGVLLHAASIANAQQYRWVDRDASVKFTDAPPPSWAKDVRKIATPQAPTGGESLPYEIARLQKDFPVTLFTTPSCTTDCNSARASLNKRGIPFKEVSVSSPETVAELKKASGGLEVPTMLVGRSVERGFEQTSFDSALDSAGYPKAGTVPPRSQQAADASAVKPAPAPAAPQATQGPYDLGVLGAPTPAKPGAYSVPGGNQ